MTELQTLVGQSREGNLRAFEELVRRFQDMAHGYAYSILGDFHLAEDAAQEAFIEAFYKLDTLREPAAFPGWFRKIVFKQCDRITRRKVLPVAPLEEGRHVAGKRAARNELHDGVLEAVQGLPETQRETTTLYYINGYSQAEIAEFLEVPLTTVQKRLHDSRRKLKERILAMVEDTLKRHAPDERFSQSVIAGLLQRPKLLEIERHPVRAAAEALWSALPEYERVEGDEAVDKSSALPFVTHPDRAYHLSDDRILRPETTVTAFLEAMKRKPPIRLAVCGRVFRPDEEDARCLKVFHQLDVLHVAEDVSETLMNATLRRAVQAVLGEVELGQEPCDYPVTENGFNVYVRRPGRNIGIAGCGMVARDFIRRMGVDPSAIRGFSFGIGLERLAMIECGVSDIRDLWRPPYVPEWQELG